MASYVTPGVYFETLDLAPRVIAPVRTDIAGFVGLAARGPAHAPKRVTSWTQYASLFGGFAANAFLPYAVKAFFDNGGTTCFVVRVVGPAARCASVPVPGRGPMTALTLTAETPAQTTVLHTDATDTVGAGDVLFIKARGRREHGVVTTLDTTATETVLTLDRPLQWGYPAGSRIAVYTPVFAIAAASPGAWANRLRVVLTRAAAGTTATTASAQPRDGSSSFVASTTGFEAGRVVRAPAADVLVGGSLVRIWQNGTTVLRRVREIDPASSRRAGALEHELVWSEPLPAHEFDLRAPIFFETVECTFDVALDGLRQRYLNLSPVAGHSRYIADVVNGDSLLIRVIDLIQRHGPAGLDPGWTDGVTPLRLGPAAAPEDAPWPPRWPVYAPPQSPARDDRPIVEEVLPEDPAAPEPAFVAYLSNGYDDLESLTPQDFTDAPPADPTVKRGLRALEDIDDVAIVAIPDAVLQPAAPPPAPVPPPRDLDPCTPPAPPAAGAPPDIPVDTPPGFSADQITEIQRAAIQHCETMHDRVAVLDPPGSDLDVEAIQNWKTALSSPYGFAGLYYPWVSVYDPVAAAGGLIRPVPPSGHVTGLYARTDLDPAGGVHKAPANAALEWVTDVTAALDDTSHGLLNERGIDVIRPYPGRGIRVFGARTISPDPDWRYVPVRRLMLMLEKAILRSSQWAVFEPNTFLTRETLRFSIWAFLLGVWRRGGLAGNTPDEAFVVRCDEDNNPPDLVAQGQLIADIGVAPVVPAEFVVFRLGRVESQLIVTEPGGR